jgi:hypothetical protein
MAAAKRAAELARQLEEVQAEAEAEQYEEKARKLRAVGRASGSSPTRGRGRGGRGGRGAGEYPRFASAVKRAADAGAHFKLTLEYRRPGAAASATRTMAFAHYDALQVEAVPTLYTSMTGEEREELLSFCNDVASAFDALDDKEKKLQVFKADAAANGMKVSEATQED